MGCEDKWGSGSCRWQKDRGYCAHGSTASNCKKTCGLCGIYTYIYILYIYEQNFITFPVISIIGNICQYKRSTNFF